MTPRAIVTTARAIMWLNETKDHVRLDQNLNIFATLGIAPIPQNAMVDQICLIEMTRRPYILAPEQLPG